LLDRVKTLAQSSNDSNELVQAIANSELESPFAHEPVTAPQVLKTLQRLDSTLIEYSAGEQDMFAFVIDHGNIHVVRVGNVETIARAAAKLNDRLRAPEPVPSHIRAAAEDLARYILWPISAYVKTDRIIFVPDDALHTIPFAVLPWSETERDKLVVHHAETTLLASAFLLSQYDRQTPYEGNRFTLIGDPVFRSSDWRRECALPGAHGAAVDNLQAVRPANRSGSARSVSDWAESLRRLPGTRTEVLAIAQLVQDSRPSSSVRTLTRCAATPSALREAAEGNSALLHIATHGRIDSHRPRLSALALTPDASAQGNAAFSLLDILSLKLHSRLVVLSACDTSRGRLLPGEGVLGLAQAFLQAGASSVVASFWRVEDEATATFMKRFYEHLISDRLPASAALRRAQLDQAFTDGTYSWAAFSLYGSPDTAL
jgi:CHAT domain-containing protein